MRRGIVRARTLFRTGMSVFACFARAGSWSFWVILGRVSNDPNESFETRPKMTPKMTHGVSAVPQPTSLKPMPQTVLM